MKRVIFYSVFLLALCAMVCMGFSWNAPAFKIPCKQNDMECKIARDTHEMVDAYLVLLSFYEHGEKVCLPRDNKQFLEIINTEYTEAIPIDKKGATFQFFIKDKYSGAFIVPVGIDSSGQFIGGYEILGGALYGKFNPPYLKTVITANQKMMDVYYWEKSKLLPPICKESESPYQGMSH